MGDGIKKFATDIKTLKKVCKIDYYSGSGKGGQHRNRHYNCVRIYHPAANITVIATEQRSQYRNKKLAFERIIERLNELNSEVPERIPTNVPRSVKKRGKENKIRHSLKKLLRKKIEE